MLGRVITFMLARPALSIAIGVTGLLSTSLFAMFLWDGTAATDFSVYWRTANIPTEMAYADRDTLPFPYAPTMMLWIEPLSLLPVGTAFILWVTVSIFALAWVCRNHLSRPEIALVVASPPLVNGLLTGQVSAMLAALMLWACSTRNRVAAGLAFAVVASIKPQLVVMAPLLLLLRRDWRAIGAGVIGSVGILLAAVVAFGVEPWRAWIASMDNFHRVLTNHNVLSVASTPAGAAEFWGLPPTPFLIAGIIGGLWLIYKCRNAGPLETTALITISSLLSVPYALTYDLAPAIPFIVWAAFRGSIWTALSIGGAAQPFPVIFTATALWKRSRHVYQQEAVGGSDSTSGDAADCRVRSMV